MPVGGAGFSFHGAANGLGGGGLRRPVPQTVAPVVNDVPPPVALSTVLRTADDQPLVNDVDACRDVFYLQPLPPVLPSKRPRPPPPGAWTQPTRDILGADSQHPYVQRWVRMTQMEARGEVKFRVVVNDGSRAALVNLLGLKNVFIKQLPNMPRAYVTRLVFDRKHESLAVMKQGSSASGIGFEAADGDTVMGGCCYRPFKDQRFAEVAFLAISQTGQERGYGTRLMAHVKERAKRCGLTHLLTCADNNAVPYFKKQGFSKKITLPFELWQGRIKDYEGVLLMECKLHPQVDYLNVPLLLKAQKCALAEKLKEVSLSHVVYPGLNETLLRRGLPIDAIPGLADISWRKDGRGGAAPSTRGGAASGVTSRDPAAQAALKKHLQSVLDQLKAHNSAWPFLEPVNPEATGAIDYYTVIKDPIDLSSIQERLNEGWYVTKNIFLADLKRMVENCRTYNGKAHYVTEMAGQLERVFLSKL
nr:GCN5 [Neoporphyra haitanensis]